MVSCCSCFASVLLIAISRAVVNCDDSSGLAPHPLVWSAGGLSKRRRIVDVVRNVALLPGPFQIWDSEWVCVPPSAVTADDVCLWPFSVWILVRLAAFLGTLHWSSAGTDLGPGGVSYVELLILFMSFGLVRGFSLRRLFLDVRGLIAQFQCRLFLLVQALILGDLASFLVPCFVRCVLCPVALAGLSLVVLALTTVGLGMLVGKNLVMVSPLGLVRLLKLAF